MNIEIILVKFEDVYRNFKIFVIDIHFIEMAKICEQSIMNYISKPQYTVEPSLTLIICLKCYF